MEGKLATLKAAAAACNWHEALRIAARFPRLGEHSADITRGWEAVIRPEFQRQLGRDPEVLIAAGIAALKARYGL